MSFHINFSDKENATRAINNGRTKPSDENVNSAVPRAKSNQTRRKPVTRVPMGERVPLGGKDGNAALPMLSRSQSTIDRSVLNNGRQRKLPMASKPPSMSRASSSLGFVHQIKPQEEDEVKLKYSRNTIFNSRSANRSPELLQDDTDSLRKQILHGDRKQDLNSSLPETFTERTAQLSSANVPRRKLVNVDPVKKTVDKSSSLNKYLQDPSRQKLYLDLINDENSIESGPAPASKNYTPTDDIPSLSEQDLAVFSNGPSHSVPTHEDELEDDDDEIDIDLGLDGFNIDENLDTKDIERENSLPEDNKDLQLGLNEEDLNDLLDF